MIGSTRIRPRFRWVIAVLVLAPVVVAGPWLYVRLATVGDLYGPGSTPPPADAILVLGAKVGNDGVPSVFLTERVTLGVELYGAGVSDTIIMSGATGPDGYDEPATMRKMALARGIPDEAIVLDREGWDTFASCANAASGAVGDLESIVVVTQEFHVARATWLCQQAGLDAQGAYPPIGRRAGTVTGNIREVPATWLAMIEVLTGRDDTRRGTK